jgi:glutamate synthase (NADPH/NADH) small chain
VGKITGFKEHSRETPARRPVAERVQDFLEVYEPFPNEKVQMQASRCMDCGIPFCHSGCPLNNLIPDWNDLIHRDRWKDAIRLLHSTNNFPEFTGRICPAPCEAACVLGINEPAVAIELIEKTIVEHAWQHDWIQPEPPASRTLNRVAVVGSGPAGLAAAQQINRAGHKVTVYEKSDRLGGLLRYGIPDFKLEKHVIDRRVAQLEDEGVVFQTRAHIGRDIPIEELRRDFDAILLAGGAEHPRDLSVPGRELRGIHFAMEFLPQQNRRNAGDSVSDPILATAKHVVIIGGGDTGADCLGTCHRQKPKSVRQFEILPMPPENRSPKTPWPLWPMQLRTESSHEEGGLRDWSIATTGFTGDDHGNVKRLHAIRVGPPPAFAPLAGTEFSVEADLVLLALGFSGPRREGLVEQLGLALDPRGNLATDANSMTSIPGIFAAGDTCRGQSLVVWAIAEGRQAARAIDEYLMGRSSLP